MEHELTILTNDGWTVSVVSDAPISVGDAVIRTIIVQPKEDFDARAAKNTGVERTVYRVGTKGERLIENSPMAG